MDAQRKKERERIQKEIDKLKQDASKKHDLQLNIDLGKLFMLNFSIQNRKLC